MESAPSTPPPTFLCKDIIPGQLFSAFCKDVILRDLEDACFGERSSLNTQILRELLRSRYSGRRAGSSFCVNVVILKQLALDLPLCLQEYHSRPLTLRTSSCFGRRARGITD